MNAGDEILIDDGRVRLRATGVSDTDVTTMVEIGGQVSNHKGINLPGVHVSVPAMSDKDVDDLRWALRQGVDFIALSFVRSAKDAEDVRDVMREEDILRPLIAKIEKPQAVENLDEVMDAFDGVMVARGDLGVELPLEEVPIVQKLIVEKARRNAKPVIVATQMLESMISAPRPTRAEASDVANAVLDGTDAVMLSGETSVGAYPIETVRTMARIIESTEEHGLPRMASLTWKPKTKSGVICRAAADVAEAIDAKYLVAFTTSGDSARRMSRYRSHIPVIAFTPDPVVRSQLALSWGVETFHVPMRQAHRRHGAAGRQGPARDRTVRRGPAGRHRGREPARHRRLHQRPAHPQHGRRHQPRLTRRTTTPSSTRTTCSATRCRSAEAQPARSVWVASRSGPAVEQGRRGHRAGPGGDRRGGVEPHPLRRRVAVQRDGQVAVDRRVPGRVEREADPAAGVREHQHPLPAGRRLAVEQRNLLPTPPHRRAGLVERAALEPELDRRQVTVSVDARQPDGHLVRQLRWIQRGTLRVLTGSRPARWPVATPCATRTGRSSATAVASNSSSRRPDLSRSTSMRNGATGTAPRTSTDTRPSRCPSTRLEPLDRPGQQRRRRPGMLLVRAPRPRRPRTAGERRLVELGVKGVHVNEYRGVAVGAEGGTRTRTPFRTTVFETVASAIPPPRPVLSPDNLLT